MPEEPLLREDPDQQVGVDGDTDGSGDHVPDRQELDIEPSEDEQADHDQAEHRRQHEPPHEDRPRAGEHGEGIREHRVRRLDRGQHHEDHEERHCELVVDQ